MSDGLDQRLVAMATSTDAELWMGLGCDLADAGREVDAEMCFRRAVELGLDWVWFNLGNSLLAQRRYEEAIVAYQHAIEAGETDAWLNMGFAMEDVGDFVGATDAYRGAQSAEDPKAAMSLAFLLRNVGNQSEAVAVAAQAADAGDELAKAVSAVWAWDEDEDSGLEQALRDGIEHYGDARTSLAHLLCATERVPEARALLEQGAKLGEPNSWLPLGNLYRDEMDDEDAAEEAYRSGIAAGDAYSHLNLGRLLEDRGDLEAAAEQFRLGAAEGDEMAVTALRELDDDQD